MRLLVTADLHFNHPRSRPLAEELIQRINGTEADGVLLVGDTAAADGDALEECLSRFRIDGLRLLVAGNHELWTSGHDSYEIYRGELPRRVRSAGWHWLEEDPFVGDGFAIVGSIGWYDYSFAPEHLRIPRPFYEAKVSPGAAARLPEFADLLRNYREIPPDGQQAIARWNDGKFVKLHRSDEQFLEELLQRLEAQLERLKEVPHVIAAVHHLPFRELLPPKRNPSWDFAQAFLGSNRIGELLLRYPNVRAVYCGHSHFPCEALTRHIAAINIGSGYGSKRFLAVDL